MRLRLLGSTNTQVPGLFFYVFYPARLLNLVFKSVVYLFKLGKDFFLFLIKVVRIFIREYFRAGFLESLPQSNALFKFIF
jgi:hypothetical protein